MISLRATRIKITVLALSPLLTLAGLLLLRRNMLPAGLSLTGLGIVAFLVIARVMQHHPIPEEDLQSLKPIALPGVLMLASLVCTLVTIYLMSDVNQSTARDYWMDVLWVVGMICLLASIMVAEKWRPSRTHLKAWWHANRRETVLVGLIVLVALGLRVYDLGAHPYPWSGDEASVGMEGRMISAGIKTNLFATGWSGQPNWSFFPTTLSLLIFGETIVGIRVVSVLAGTLAVLFTYLFARQAFNRQVAFLAAAFLAAFPVNIHFSRIGVNNINDSLMIVLVLWLTLRAIESGKASLYVLAGIGTGLALYTYVGTRLVFGLAFCVMLYAILSQRGFLRNNLIKIGLFGLAAVLTAAPVGYFFFQHPDIFMTRIGQEGIFLNGWLQNESQITGLSISELLLRQVSRSTLVFISQPAPGNFFNSSQPYLTITGAIFALLGLGYTFQRTFKLSHAILLGWFWSVILLGGILTLNPPANTRLVMTGPAVAIFVGLGIWLVGQVLERVKIPIKILNILGIALIVLLAIENGSYYFGKYRSSHAFQDANAELALEIGLQLKELGPRYELYMFGMPRVFAGFPTTQFLAPDNPKYDLVTETIATVNISNGQGAFFAAIPDNYNDLLTISEKYPGGEWITAPRKNFDETLYFAYVISPENK